MTKFPATTLQSQLEYALGSPHSDFYRQHLAGHTSEAATKTQQAWEQVPFLERSDIKSHSPLSRVFCAPEDVTFVRNTSGTSGSGILVSPRTAFGDYEDVFGLTSGDYLRLFSFLFPAFSDVPRNSMAMDACTGDVADLQTSAQIAKRMHANALWVTPSTAIVFADHLEAVGHLDQIQAVFLLGERCSPLHLSFLRKRYPDADVVVLYGSSETKEPVAYTPRELRRTDSLQLKASPDYFFELRDPETKEIIHTPEAYGELVVTTLPVPVPFPAIRYATGDLVRRSLDQHGYSHDGYSYFSLGRVNVLPVRVPMGEFTSDAIEQALFNTEGVSADYFEAEYSEAQQGESIRPALELKVVSSDTAPVPVDEVQARLAAQLFINEKDTYADGVKKDLYGPLVVSYIPMPPIKNNKRPPSILRRKADYNSS